jgi:hypothetical protein
MGDRLQLPSIASASDLTPPESEGDLPTQDVYWEQPHVHNDDLFRLKGDATEGRLEVQTIHGAGDLSRGGHSATLFPDLSPWNLHRVLIFGGRSERSDYLNDVRVFQVEVYRWFHPEISGALPEPREQHAACSAGAENDQLIIHGGFGSNGALDDMHILDLNTWTWTEVEYLPDPSSWVGSTGLEWVITPRFSHSMFSHPLNGKGSTEVLYITGGRNLSRVTLDCHLHRFDLTNKCWVQPPKTNDPEPRSGGALVEIPPKGARGGGSGARMLLLGGWNAGHSCGLTGKEIESIVRGDPSEHVDIHELELGHYENWSSQIAISPKKKKQQQQKPPAAAGGQQHLLGLTADTEHHLAASQTAAFGTSGMGEGSSVEKDSGWSSQRVQKEREKAARRQKLELLRREEKRRQDEKDAREKLAREGRNAMRRKSILEGQSAPPNMWKAKTKGRMKVAGLLAKGVEKGDCTLIPVVWSAVRPPIPGGEGSKQHSEMVKFSHSVSLSDDPNDRPKYPQQLRQLHGPPECARHGMAYLSRLDCMLVFGGVLAGSTAQCVPTDNSYGGIHLLSMSRRRWLPTTAPPEDELGDEGGDHRNNGHAGAAYAGRVPSRYGHAMVAVGERVLCFFGHPDPSQNHPKQTLDEVLVTRGLEDAYEERSRLKVEAICAARWQEQVEETERLLQVHKVAYAERIWMEELMRNDKDTAHVETFRMRHEDAASLEYEMTTLRPAPVPDPPCPKLRMHWRSASAIKFCWSPITPVKSKGGTEYCTDIVYLLRVSKQPAREYMAKLPYLKGLCTADTEKDFDLVYAGRDCEYVLASIVPEIQLHPASGNQGRAFDAKRMARLKEEKKAEIKMMLHEKKLAQQAAERRKKKGGRNKNKKEDSDEEEEDDDGIDVILSDLPEEARLVSLSYLNQQKQQDRAGRWHAWESEMSGFPDTRVKNKWGFVEGKKRIWLIGAPGTSVVHVQDNPLALGSGFSAKADGKKKQGKRPSLEAIQAKAAADTAPKCQFGKGHEDDLNSGRVVVDTVYEDVFFATSGAWQRTAPGPHWEGKRNAPKPGEKPKPGTTSFA